MKPTEDTLAAEIGLLASGILDAELRHVRGFSTLKDQGLAAITILIGEAHARELLSGAEMADEMRDLNVLVIRFSRTLPGLTQNTRERLVRGVTRLLFRTLSGFAPIPPVTAIA